MQIVPGNDNAMAIELITTHVKKMLKDRSVKFRERMARAECFIMRPIGPSEGDLLDGIVVLPDSPQLKVSIRIRPVH